MNKSKIQKEEVQAVSKKPVSSRAEISRRYYLKKSLLEGKVPKNADLDDVKLQKVSKLNTIVEQLKNKKNGITIIPNSKPKYREDSEDEDLEVTDDEDEEPDSEESEDDEEEEEDAPDYRFDELNEKLDAITEMLEFLLKQTKVQPEEEVENNYTEKQQPYRRIPKIIFM